MLTGTGARNDRRAELEALLRCPDCNAGLAIDADEAVCSDGAHRFPVIEGIPVLVDEAVVAADPQYAGQRRYFDAEFARYVRSRPENWRLSYLDRLRSVGALGTASAPVIDIGVGGSGYTVIEAARAGHSAVGCDLSLEGLLAARRFADEEGVGDRILWICCSAERLPIASASCSSALAIAVLEHVPDDAAALAELARVLEPEGRAWVTVPHALQHISPLFRPANRRHDAKLGHLRRYEAQTLAGAGRRVGLVEKEVQFTGHPIKVIQLAAAKMLRGRAGDRFWWWCESRDLRASNDRRGSMQLSVLFVRSE